MRMDDLAKLISNMTDEELEAHVRKMRANKTTIRPASVKRKEEKVKKETNQQASKVNKLVSNMSEAEKAQLRLLLEGGE